MRRGSLRHRIPVPLRRNWRWLGATVVVAVVAVVAFGSVMMRPYSTSANVVADNETIVEDVAGTVDLFDESVAHEVVLSFTQDDYDRMIDAYFEDGSKEWITADVTIDGTTIDSVGLRLKGNSTLRGLQDDREGSEASGQGEAEADPTGETPGTDGQDATAPDAGMGGGMGGGTSATLLVSEPQNLPVLISFDKYVGGRAYQGMTELSVRPAGATYGSLVNEALSLELTAASGQASQRYAYTTYEVNDEPVTTRLVVENPDAQYASRLGDSTSAVDGVLYKVLSTSSFSYLGEDPTAYTDQFDQVNLVETRDLQPVIDFLRWLDEASDEEFAAELDQWVDVDSLAEYQATQEVLENFDSLSGPGRNGYLWYDLETGLLSVVSWDLNLAFSGMGMGGGGMAPGAMPEGEGTGMPQFPGGGMPSGGETGGEDLPQFPQDGQAPGEGGGRTPPGGDAEGGGPPEGMAGGPDAQGGMGGMDAENALITRFEANEGFAARVDAAVEELRSAWFETGRAAELLDAIAGSIPATTGLPQETIDTETETLRASLTEGSGDS